MMVAGSGGEVTMTVPGSRCGHGSGAAPAHGRARTCLSICSSATFPWWPPSEVVRAVRAGIDPVWPQHDRSPPRAPVGPAKLVAAETGISAPVGETECPGCAKYVVAFAADQVIGTHVVAVTYARASLVHHVALE